MLEKIKKYYIKQQNFCFIKKIDICLENIKKVINDASEIKKDQQVKPCINFKDACMELAGAIKKSVKASGLSRGDVADKINSYFGWPTISEMEELREAGKDKNLRHLSLHMFNHYLSKPVEYPIPGAYLYAIQYVTGSLEVCSSIAEAEDAEVVSKEERDTLMVGKMYDAKIEISRLMNEFKKKRR